MPFNFNSNNWIHQSCLDYCLQDYRLYKSFRENFFDIIIDNKIFGIKSETDFRLPDEDDRLVHVRFFNNTTLEYYASSQNKEQIDAFFDEIENAIRVAIKNNEAVNLTAIKKELHDQKFNDDQKIQDVVTHYHLAILHAIASRSQQMQEEISATQIEQNNKVFSEIPDPFEDPLKKQPSGKMTENYSIQGQKYSGKTDNPYSPTEQNEDCYAVSEPITIDKSWEQRIPELLLKISQDLTNFIYQKEPCQQLIETVYQNAIEQDIKEKVLTKTISQGTTATFLLIHDGKVNVAWIGDSPVYLITRKISSGNIFCRKLTQPHHVNNREDPFQQSERNRIANENGAIKRDYVCADITGLERYNAIGDIEMSRDIGDRNVPGRSDIPSFVTFNLPSENDEEYVVIAASDGLEYLTCDEIAKTYQKNSDIAKLPKALCEKAESNKKKKIIEKHGFLKRVEGEKLIDDISVVATNEKDKLICIFDNHGGKDLAEWARDNVQTVFKQTALQPAPEKFQIDQAEDQRVLQAIKTEIKKTDFHAGIGGFFHPKNNDNTGDDKKHLTTATKKVLSTTNLTKTSKIFTRAASKFFTLFRSSEADIFYLAYSDPRVGLYAKETLDEIYTSFKKFEWEINKGGNTVSAVDNPSNKKKYPAHVASFIKYYKDAKKYNQITMQETLFMAEKMLLRLIKSNRSASHIEQYKKALVFIQTNFYSPLINNDLVGIEFKYGFFQYYLKFEGKFDEKYSLLQTEIRTKINDVAMLEWDASEKIMAQKKILALQYLSYHIFKISQKITYGFRNGDDFYKACMKKIAVCLGMDTKMNDNEIRNTVEKFMRKHLSYFEHMANTFQKDHLSNIPIVQNDAVSSHLLNTNVK